MKNKLTTLMVGLSLLSGISYAQDSLNITQQINELKPQKLSSVLVIKDNKLLHESYYNEASAQSLHNIRSASKSFTGLMFGVAIKDGYFESVQDKVLPWFKDYQPLFYPSDEKTNMRFFDLLSMTNPLECDDMNSFSAGNEERMYLRKDWIEFFLNLPTRGNPPWMPTFEQQAYGRSFAYCTAGISITAAAIERASGKSLADYAQSALFDKLDIKEVHWPKSPMGITQGGGGVDIKPRDLIKIGQLVLNKGKWGNEQLIPQDWIEKSLQSYSESMPELNATYGLTFWHFPYQVNGKTIDSYAAAGNGGNYLYIVPALNLTAVITSTAYNTPYMHKQSQSIFSQVILPKIVSQP